MIFHPGAAEELRRTQTLLEHARAALRPRGFDCIPAAPKSHASFAGIDGIPAGGKPTARSPIDLGPVITNFETATIGGSGDRCPAFLFE